MAAPSSVKNNNFAASVVKIIGFGWLLKLLLCSACRSSEIEGFLLCRKCGFALAKAQDLFSLPSKQADGVRNDTITKHQKVFIQLFRNPHGDYFEVITSLAADVETDNLNFGAASFFPGYKWSIAKCPRCGTHIGWVFTAVKSALEQAERHISSFVGIILGHVMHEDEVNNLIITPKLYHS